MKIIECYIDSFGKIKNKKFSFSDGLNCIKEDNGTGKTTLSVFIKVMLYGMGDTKKPSLEENDRKHYLPWDGSLCGGTLTFLTAGKKYRIERTFGQKASEDTLTLVDIALGRTSRDFTEPIGESLFGIDKEGFERTVFLSERCLTPKSDNKSVSAKLSDLVGSDGDIGVMDEAMKILENQRKYYQKKGGVGEITNVKDELYKLEDKLARLDGLSTQLELEERSLKETNEKVRELREKKRTLSEKRDRALAAKAGDEQRARHKRLLSSVDEDTKKRDSLIEFFGGEMPSFAEIDTQSAKAAEAHRLRREAEGEAGAEYTELSRRFMGRVSREEIERAERAVERVLDAQKKRDTAEGQKHTEMFSKRIPHESEVDKLIFGYKKAKTGSFVNITLLILGVLLTLLGVVIGSLVSPWIYTASIFGIVTLTFSIYGTVRSARQKGMWESASRSLIASISDSPVTDELYGYLVQIKEALEAVKDRPMPSDEDMRTLYDLVGRLGYKDDTDLIAAVREIISSYRRYELLSTYEEYRRSDGQKRLATAEQLETEVAEFLAPYKLSGPEAFTQLREALREYSRLSERIVETRSEIAMLEGASGFDAYDADATSIAEDIERESALLEEELNSLLRKITLHERQCASINEELDGRDVINMRREELSERLARYEDNYKIILLTKNYLTRAKDAVTSKYLGKTKASFEKYAELIGADRGEYDMDTSFAVMRREGARSHPVEAYSKGTRDLFNIAARFALIDSLYENESPFVILDDPFISFDDGRAARAIKLISEIARERQIIYFTCSGSRAI